MYVCMSVSIGLRNIHTLWVVDEILMGSQALRFRFYCYLNIRSCRNS